MVSMQELQISMFYHVMDFQTCDLEKKPKKHGELNLIVFFLLVFSSFLTLNTCSKTLTIMSYLLIFA